MEYFTDLGYLGLFISCFLAATFIIPFSPEVILGILIVKGFSLPVTILVATIGNWLGGMTSYFVGRIGDWKKIEKCISIEFYLGLAQPMLNFIISHFQVTFFFTVARDSNHMR